MGKKAAIPEEKENLRKLAIVMKIAREHNPNTCIWQCVLAVRDGLAEHLDGVIVE